MGVDVIPMSSMYSDSWYDFLAIPIAPLVLMSQIGAMCLPFPTSRRVIVSGASALMIAMTIIVFAVPSEGANIGAGLIVPQLCVSLALTAVELATGRSDRPPPGGP